MEFIQTYFAAESNESLLFIGIGLISIIVSAVFYFRVKKDLFNGIAIALIAFAVIQIAVGSSVYIQTPNHIKRAQSFAAKAKIKIEKEEIPRMEKVMKNFKIFKYLEIGIMIIGIILVFFAKSELYKGVGYGVIIQAAILLILDFLAEKRGHEYLENLQQLLLS